jgi:hypothetical protein
MGAQYVTPYKLKLDEGNLSKHASLAQQNGFGPAFFAQFVEASKRHSKVKHLWSQNPRVVCL